MSKLFEAINSLEANTSQVVVESPFDPKLLDVDDAGAKTKPKGKRLLVSAGLIVILAVAIGLGALLILRKMSRPELSNQVLHKVQTPVYQANIADHAKTTIRVQTDNSSVSASKTKTGLGKQTAKVDTHNIASSFKEIKGAGQKVKKKHNEGSDINPLPSTLTLKDRSASQEVLAPLVANPLILNSRQKRLLYRAEKLRKSGLENQALALYKKIWNKSHNPLVANNLAAILMEKGEYQEAKDILEQAIDISPGDNDLIYNLKQVKAFIRAKETAY